MKGFRNVIYLSLSLGMLVFAIPRLQMGGGVEGITLPTVFGIVWLAFALVIVAANLHHILGVDDETQEALDRIRRVKRRRLEESLRGHSSILHARK